MENQSTKVIHGVRRRPPRHNHTSSPTAHSVLYPLVLCLTGQHPACLLLRSRVAGCTTLAIVGKEGSTTTRGTDNSSSSHTTIVKTRNPPIDVCVAQHPVCAYCSKNVSNITIHRAPGKEKEGLPARRRSRQHLETLEAMGVIDLWWCWTESKLVPTRSLRELLHTYSRLDNKNLELLVQPSRCCCI